MRVRGDELNAGCSLEFTENQSEIKFGSTSAIAVKDGSGRRRAEEAGV